MCDSAYLELQRKARIVQRQNEAIERLGRFQELPASQLPPNTCQYTNDVQIMKLDDSQDQSGNNNRCSSGASSCLWKTPALDGRYSAQSTGRNITSPLYTPLPNTPDTSLHGTGLHGTGLHGNALRGTGLQYTGLCTPTPDLGTRLEHRSIYSRSEFPEFEDDRELFDTFTYP